MKEIKNTNIWDTKYNNQSIYFNDIDKLIEYLEKIDKHNFTICEKHMPEEPTRLILDRASTKQNICITYTNETHNVTIVDFGILGTEIIIHPTFYQKHQDKIIKYIKKNVQKQIEENKSYILIPDIIITNKLIDLLISNEDLTKSSIAISNIMNLTLTEEQINKIKNAHLNLSYEHQQISSNKLIENYALKDLREMKTLRINCDHPLEEIENFIYLNDNCLITISPSEKKDEPTYINNLKKIFQILEKHNKTYNIKIEINNRQLLKQSNILKTKNINFIINNDLHDYQKDEYLKEEEQLDKLIEPIKNANLSPYEKYIAVYNLVKQFKPYKENQDDKDQSRYLRYILNNEYIVCVGYAKLLKTLLDKLDIPCIEISVGVDISYDQGFTEENIETDIEGHERNIIKIDDDKYNIHGIYIADATWDNDEENDLYNNISLTFDRKKEARRLESLTPEDLLLDFHNFEEFTKKLNYYLKKEITYEKNKENEHTKCVLTAYYQAYAKIMTMLSSLDYPKYHELYNKYDKKIKENEDDLTKADSIYSEFLTEYAMYIIPLSNNKIDTPTLLEAAINTKKELYKFKLDELVELKEKLTSKHEYIEYLSFPYYYNPEEPTEYVEKKK